MQNKKGHPVSEITNLTKKTKIKIGHIYNVTAKYNTKTKG